MNCINTTGVAHAHASAHTKRKDTHRLARIEKIKYIFHCCKEALSLTRSVQYLCFTPFRLLSCRGMQELNVQKIKRDRSTAIIMSLVKMTQNQRNTKMWTLNYDQNYNDIITIFGLPILPKCLLVQLYRSLFPLSITKKTEQVTTVWKGSSWVLNKNTLIYVHLHTTQCVCVSKAIHSEG